MSVVGDNQILVTDICKVNRLSVSDSRFDSYIDDIPAEFDRSGNGFFNYVRAGRFEILFPKNQNPVLLDEHRQLMTLSPAYCGDFVN